MANDIQIKLSAPGLEAAVKALTEAIVSAGSNSAKTDIPAGRTAPVAETQSAAQQAQTGSVTVGQPAQLTNASVPAPVQTGVTLEAIVTAGAGLVEKGMMNQVIALLGKYGVQAVNQIQPQQYEAFAAELRTLGAQI